MRYFIPEWDDRVDPRYDFIHDRHSSAHTADPLTNDVYMWDIFGVANVPFDGLLVSIATIQEKKTKYQTILDKGIHGFFRLPQSYPIMADCGAFSYIDEKEPPYSTVQVLKLYSDLGFNYGVSVDHLVVPSYKEQSEARMLTTYMNGLAAHELWLKEYRDDFQLIVAVQGDTVADYLDMYNRYLDRGITHLAFGGLVRSPTAFIRALLDALLTEIRATKRYPEYIHFFGLARCALFPQFKEIEEFGIQVAFDSASYLRKAWLSSPDTQLNYITPEWTGYTAIRIPERLKGKRKTLVLQSTLDTLGSRCLAALRQFDRGETSLEDVLLTLSQLNSAIQEKPKLVDYYRRLLEDQPWKTCPCPICQKHGIEVIIFRGNNRNRRRGFHNTWAFYQMLKDEENWKKCQSLEREDSPIKEIESLSHLERDRNVLIITGCTKRKLGPVAPAKDLYQGTIFRKVREYAESMGFDYVIISAKHGLLFPESVIEEYEQVLKSAEDIEAIRPDVEERLGEILDQYDTIVVIAGSNYRKVLENIADDRFVFLKARGIGDLCSAVARAIPKMNRSLKDFISFE